MDMIERGAKAIEALGRVDAANYRDRRAIVRAVIEAMRNPGMDALDAMNDIAIDGPGYVSFYPSLHDCAVLFNAGIDAALSTVPPGEI